MAVVGTAADDLAALAKADPHAQPWIAELEAVRARGEATARAQLAVSGDDLVAAGIVQPGPALGRMLAALLDVVIEDPARNHRDALLEAARATVT
jgi:tRNA nucleotidyltransferase (CCA-adding enzyme)